MLLTKLYDNKIAPVNLSEMTLTRSRTSRNQDLLYRHKADTEAYFEKRSLPKPFVQNRNGKLF